MRNIQDHCRKLKHVDINGRYLNSAAYSECLISYGNQLQHAAIREMTRVELEDVLQKSLVPEGNLFPHLKSIGPRLEKVGPTSWYLGEWSDSSDVWDSCQNLREIMCCRPLEVSAFQSMFNSPKPVLTRLELNLGDFKAMSIFDSGFITTLESVVLWGGFPPENPFESLVKYNKSLHNIFIKIYGEYENMQENEPLLKVREMTSCFLSSPSIETLDINDWNAKIPPGVYSSGYFTPVKEILRTEYRHQRVEVRIFNQVL